MAESLETLALEEMEADLVSFNSCAEHWWIHQVLDLPSKWWVLRSSKTTLLLEIRELVKAKNKTSSSRLPKQADCLVRLTVRNRLLVMQNSTSHMNLAPTDSLDNKTGTL